MLVAIWSVATLNARPLENTVRYDRRDEERVLAEDWVRTLVHCEAQITL
jgi:hypothetical protein